MGVRRSVSKSCARCESRIGQKSLKPRVELKAVKKEQWIDILDTGVIYEEACRATRRTLPFWLEKTRNNPDLLVGPQTFEEDTQKWKHIDKVRKGKATAPLDGTSIAEASVPATTGDGAAGARQSRSPSAAGPMSPSSPSRTSQTMVGDADHRDI